MESNSTTMTGAAALACAHTSVWRDRLQPGTRLLADIGAPLQGTTLPTFGAGKAGLRGQVAVSPAVAVTTTTVNYMDVPPFRTGRPPV